LGSAIFNKPEVKKMELLTDASATARDPQDHNPATKMYMIFGKCFTPAQG
jgi:hypothetical protein